ncbi:MAG: type II toxin-antitoxin system YoeB family toxin [Oscillospiraceae bacterium]|nr:type II toxin-antitoxin system YoeB family toxin [Oscillospiraceae bacterium]
MSVKFSPLALEQFFSVEESDKRLFRGLKKMITDIQRNGTGGLGHPEALSGNLAGWWSKQIDDANRLVFRITGAPAIVEIAECCTHYGDK